jgi:hypothetical protein
MDVGFHGFGCAFDLSDGFVRTCYDFGFDFLNFCFYGGNCGFN